MENSSLTNQKHCSYLGSNNKEPKLDATQKELKTMKSLRSQHLGLLLVSTQHQSERERKKEGEKKKKKIHELAPRPLGCKRRCG